MFKYENTCDSCGENLGSKPDTIIWSLTISQVSPTVTYPNTYKLCDKCYQKILDSLNEKTYK